MAILNSAWTRPFSLVLFYALSACSNVDRAPASINILWREDQPVGVVIPGSVLGRTQNPGSEPDLTVHLHDPADSPPMLGNLTDEGDAFIFEPLIPFSRGRQYDVRLNGGLLQTVDIPLATDEEPPRLVNIYPSADTVPVNLLKVYLKFSHPMQIGRSLDHVTVIRDSRDTVRDIFLPLQPELWDREGSTLTLWLDPGRIKRDLQPNKRMGQPLEIDHRYTLIIDSSWADVVGNSLRASYSRRFSVAARDSLSPDPNRWLIRVPAAGSRSPLSVSFGEALDAVLLREAISVVFGDEEVVVPGVISPVESETGVQFQPDAPWRSGRYFLVIESRLEDLAGNNLNRPFDRDILTSDEPSDQSGYRREFVVR